MDYVNGLHWGFYGYLNHKTKKLSNEQVGQSSPIVKPVIHIDGEWYKAIWDTNRGRWVSSTFLYWDSHLKRNVYSRRSSAGAFSILEHLPYIETFSLKGFSCKTLSNGHLKWSRNESV